MAAKHEWMTDGMSFDASEKVLSDYEAEGWELVSLSWDDGSFFGCWKRPVKKAAEKPQQEEDEDCPTWCPSCACQSCYEAQQKHGC